VPSPSQAPADLILVGHGSREPGAGEVLGGLRDAVAARLAPAQVTLAWIELDAPLVADLVANLVSHPQARAGAHRPSERPPIVVPLLLSRGTHVVRDLPPTATAPLGPDPLLTRILLDRIAEAAIAAGRPLVLAATGTSHPEGVSDVTAQAAMLEAAWGAPVRAGFVTAEPSLASAAAAASAASANPGARAAIVSYFLAPGRLSDGAGADTEHLGHHPTLVELVLARYRGAAPVGVTQMGL
jgi:sirohydrochlorin ferrochelatase